MRIVSWRRSVSVNNAPESVQRASVCSEGNTRVKNYYNIEVRVYQGLVVNSRVPTRNPRR